MYQPRRSTDSAAIDTDAAVAVAFRVSPRRAARTRADMIRTRVAPTAVSVALLAASGGFALNLKASENATTAVPAPVRDAETLSRDSARTLIEAPATPEQADAAASEQPADQQVEPGTEGAEAFVAGEWATAFGAAAGTKYAQADLTVRAQASGEAAEIGSLKSGDKVSVTDKVDNGFRQIAIDGKVGYVLDSKLGDEAPAKPAPKPAPAPAKPAAAKTATPEKVQVQAFTGKSVLGLKPRAMVVYNAVTARWSFSSIGGYRASSLSNHQFGGAIDFMLTPGKDSAKGWAIANFVSANAAAFNIDHIIFEQKIWTPYKPYWRPMENRGSITANHYDHVHVSVKL